jgi:hypothetical protein
MALRIGWQIVGCTQKELKIFYDTHPPLLLHHLKNHLHLTPINLNLNRVRTRIPTRPLIQTPLSNRWTLNRNGIIILRINLIVSFTICRSDASPHSIVPSFTFCLDIISSHIHASSSVLISKRRWIENVKRHCTKIVSHINCINCIITISCNKNPCMFCPRLLF